jgi:Zn-dependent peptidase ImmA (M78 family)
MYEDLIQYLEKRYKKKYTALEVEQLADSILIENNPAELVAPTPIVKIVSDFGVKAFKIEKLGKDISGNIYIGGTTEKVFHHDKVIVVQAKEEFYHQRFIIAHELGHYLLDYIGNPTFEHPKKFFSKTYIKTEHEYSEDILVDKFAAELLMPSRLFLQKYINIMDYSRNNIVFTVTYLSVFFEVEKEKIIKRITEIIEGG